MKIVISGHTGFIGKKLKSFFQAKGYEITGIGREDFARGKSHLSQLISGSDILINLAGAPIIKRWTKSYSKKLWDSRIVTTRLLSDAIAGSSPKPKAFFSASAIGIYSGEGIHSEASTGFDNDFLGILCQRWEEEASSCTHTLQHLYYQNWNCPGKEGGALPQMALPFKMFFGGKLGTGRQVTSWIHIDDFAEGLHMLIQKLPERAIFNFTAPKPVSNAEFSSLLAKTLKRPNLFQVPGFALRLLYGEGSIALLNGQYVVPENLLMESFEFKYPELEGALENLLGK